MFALRVGTTVAEGIGHRSSNLVATCNASFDAYEVTGSRLPRHSDACFLMKTEMWSVRVSFGTAVTTSCNTKEYERLP